MSDAVMITLITTIGTIATTTLALLIKVWYDVREQHKATNSRFDQLLESKGREQRALGKAEGRAEGKGESES